VSELAAAMVTGSGDKQPDVVLFSIATPLAMVG
jgi:hypothetical protein